MKKYRCKRCKKDFEIVEIECQCNLCKIQTKKKLCNLCLEVYLNKTKYWEK